MQASDIRLNKQQLKILSFWYAHKKEYSNSNGIFDLTGEKNLKDRISKEFDIPVKDIHDLDSMINLHKVKDQRKPTRIVHAGFDFCDNVHVLARKGALRSPPSTTE
ncbi:TPA: hypothetical protein ACOP2N_004605 [Salmonella enterica]|nr:hypothetical protein [Salmonella enterica subsp. enterica]EDT6893211.1 hypothetical protein [Salmonella enterica subsp. enterica serovar Javiana]EED2931536.1 hypothetical protein [Salmonella enterica subsp. enterica serovar Javiana]MIY24256.1 hypothetical protein [Salmonella enterica subsp. enterica]HCM6292779.1 hypothetical protein [Salmonella enterica subsp. enterica serovar 16:l,v:-]